MKLNKLAQGISFICIVGPVAAQTSPPPQKVQKVEITGSSIKRVQDETALPLQIITRDDIERNGITSAEQLIGLISANAAGADNAISNNNVFGTDTDRLTGGSANANLRGLGPTGTLVLLNGRRVATHGMSGASVDLNAIPIGAVERVEVLKDGASAIYGTDAIGGVINFILRKDFAGLELSGSTNMTEAGGGTTRRASVLFGIGSLAQDGYNFMASITADKDDQLRSKDRSFSNGFQPTRGLSPNTTSAPYANIINATGSALPTAGSTIIGGGTTSYTRFNPLAIQGNCGLVSGQSPYQTLLWTAPGASAASKAATFAGTTYACVSDYGSDYTVQNPAERVNIMSRANFQLGAEHNAFAEFTASRVKVGSEFVAAQLSTSLAAGNLYPVNGPYYQNLRALGVTNFDPTRPIAYRWRLRDFGNRKQENVSENSRLLVGLEGIVGGRFDYKLGLSTANAEATTDLVDGYVYTARLNAALGTGIINPWLLPGQTQTAAAQALIDSTKAQLEIRKGKTKLTQFDGAISGEAMSLPAGALSFATGFDVRKEAYEYTDTPGLDVSTILLAPGNAPSPKRTRDIKAVYGELIIPVTKELEFQLAVRHDKYSEIGSTTNPKLAFKFSPMQEIVFRGSVNTGFRAPSVQQLYAGTITRELTALFDDPVLCPTTPAQCGLVGQDFREGGNPNLKPEKSRQGSFGFVVAPVPNITAYADYWRVDLEDRIRTLQPAVIISNFTLFPNSFVRRADGTLDYIQAGWINAANSSDRGVDVGVRTDGKLHSGKWSASIDGTYLMSHKERALENQPLVELVGKFGTRTIYLRWKHTARFTWTSGDWSTTASQSFKSGYADQDMTLKGTMPADINKDVASYTLYNLSGSYTGFKNLKLNFGIKNIFDKDPPFTHHDVDDVVGAGWDPRVADPRGRAYWFSANYKFK